MASETEAKQSWVPPPEGSPCWVEIPAVNIEACKQFYTALFPSWEFKPETSENNGTKVTQYSFAKPVGLGGGIVQLPADCKPAEQKNGMGMTIYYFVNSVDETEKRVHQLGGSTCLEKQPQGDSGFFACMMDVEGNRFGIYECKSVNE